MIKKLLGAAAALATLATLPAPALAGDDVYYATRAGGLYLPDYWVQGPRHSITNNGIRVNNGYGCFNARNSTNTSWVNSTSFCTGSGTVINRDYCGCALRYGTAWSGYQDATWSAGYGHQYW